VRATKPLYRRCSHLVIYWHGRDLVFERYAPPTVRVTAAPVTIEILEWFGRWHSAESLFRRLPQYSHSSIRKTLKLLVDRGLLERSDRPKTSSAMRGWESWSPSAALLHFSSKDTPFDTNLETAFTELCKQARRFPPPSSVKHYRHTGKIKLLPPAAKGEFPEVLLARRTWRNFSSKPLSFADLSTLLGLTWGVQSWLKSRRLGRYALKTSPSGGALHPIEAYVLAPGVSGLPPGLYHYAADTHQLELIRKGASAGQVEEYLATQWWFRSAAALVFMTAVFPRTQWKYQCPRAYRVVLTEAGHFCQTFCLVATWLKLAPFCTLALADSLIEHAIRVDGVNESVLYAAGVGVPPENQEWTPMPVRKNS